jgi:3-deoxy-manno-octulosonate cytidylyltransferase (CMP-KDO synthetase)
MNFLGIIPARYGSTRLEGKPLADICGKPMIQWVYEQSSKALDCVYVATDDERIAGVVRSFGGKVVLTSPDHLNGTSRCLEAWTKIKTLEETVFHAAINIQGDEPLLHPDTLTELKRCFESADTRFATLAIKVAREEDLQSDSEVFVTINKKGEAMYFSRSVIPFLRGYQKKDWLQKGVFYKHLGFYAYTFDTLKEFSSMPPSSLELTESLEQLRWLENGNTIKVGIAKHYSMSVDTPEDLIRVRQLMDERTLKGF